MTEGALVLEGGSLRCLFTAGVLDVFLEKQVELSYVIGVSAGSLSGINYVSKQPGRTAKVNIDFVKDHRYLGINNLLSKRRSIFNFDFLFGDISERLVPLDKEEFYRSPQKFISVVTNCDTGEAEYIGRDEYKDAMLAARASCSMPLLSQMVSINEGKYLDGGIAMPIAYQKAMDDDNKKVVVVLTREDGYRKKEQGKAIIRAYERMYRNYPKLVKTLKNMTKHYNEMQEEMEQLEKEGKIFVIRPSEPVLVSRVEKDTEKLRDLYEKGRKAAEEQLEALQKYLSE